MTRKKQPSNPGAAGPVDTNTPQRINKVLATAGLGSRREVEQLILQGRVEVDGRTVTNLATRVAPKQAKVSVDGVPLKLPKLVYYALNKPKGVLSTSSDPTGRLRVIDFVPDKHRVFSVGRLDRYSEGLILLTNDGDLAQRLAHPKYRVQKCYFVVVAGALTNEELAKLRKGVYLAEGMARIDGARIRKTRKSYTELEILLSEGKNREIRRILARAGHKVMLLRRIAIGTLRLAELPVGAVRELSSQEIKSLYACTQPATAKKKSDKSTQATAQPATPGKIVTPIESKDFDDFGLGLEEDYQYNPEDLVVTEDAEEFGAGEDDSWDDDFAVDHSLPRPGSVLEYDDQPRKPKSPRTGGKLNQSSRRHESREQSRSSTHSTKGSRVRRKTSESQPNTSGRSSKTRSAGSRSTTRLSSGKPSRDGDQSQRPAGRRSSASAGKFNRSSKTSRKSAPRKPRR